MVTVLCCRFIHTFGNVNCILGLDLKWQLIEHLRIKKNMVVRVYVSVIHPNAPYCLCLWCSGPWFNIKMSSYQYRKSHCGDKTVVRSPYLHNGISYTGKMSSLYWIGALVKMIVFYMEAVQLCCSLNDTLSQMVHLAIIAGLDCSHFNRYRCIKLDVLIVLFKSMTN